MQRRPRRRSLRSRKRRSTSTWRRQRRRRRRSLSKTSSDVSRRKRSRVTDDCVGVEKAKKKNIYRYTKNKQIKIIYQMYKYTVSEVNDGFGEGVLIRTHCHIMQSVMKCVFVWEVSIKNGGGSVEERDERVRAGRTDGRGAGRWKSCCL